MNFDQFTGLLGIDESYKAPEAIMNILMEPGERRSRFMQDVIALDHDLSHDTLQSYYEDEQALRGNHKQDYTPTSISRLASMLTGDTSSTVSDPTAGTGSMIIARWWDDCLRSGSPFTYKPSEHLYVCQELSDRAIPFLLLNLMMRGMNAIVIHGDTLTMEHVKGVLFIQNDRDDPFHFSSLNVMPYTDEVRTFLSIHSWATDAERYRPHIESPLHVWLPATPPADTTPAAPPAPITDTTPIKEGHYVQDAIID